MTIGVFAYLDKDHINIDTETITISQGAKHTLTITDKTADKVYSYKTVIVRKKANNRPKAKAVETDTISIKIDGRMFYIYDKVGNEYYEIKN